MKPDWRNLARLEMEQDQDIAGAVEWWNNTSDADKIRLWMRIQRPEQNPLIECLTRMAQIGMTAVAIAAEKARTK